MVAVVLEAIVDEQEFTDDELTALALAADPDTEVCGDAQSLWELLGASETRGRDGALPQWYMPAALTGARPERKQWHRGVALAVIMSFLLIDALGLCITYGQLVAA
jgi:hypothetical protein